MRELPARGGERDETAPHAARDGEAEREASRLADLRRLRILDTEPDGDFDLIAQTAAALFNMPIALVSFVDESRQWFKVAFGLDSTQTPRDIAFCAYAIEDPENVLLVSDTTQDPRFKNNPMVVNEPNIRFYAGAPLVSSSGFALGTLCVIDRRPRSFDAEQGAALKALAGLVMRLLERKCGSCETPPKALPNVGTPSLGVVVFGWNENAEVGTWNNAGARLLGWTAADVLGRVPPFMSERDRAGFCEDRKAVLDGADDVVRLCTIETKAQQRLEVAMRTSRSVDASGGVSIVSTVEVISSRIETERRLAMLESVVVNSSDTVIVTAAMPINGVRNVIIYVNAAFTEMTGFSADEAIGNSPRMLQGITTDKREVARMNEALARRENVSAEIINYRKDGTSFWVEMSISPVFDADGWCMYNVAIERDTTQRRILERYEQDRALVLEMAVRNEPLTTQLARIVRLLSSVIPDSMGTVMLVEGDCLVAGAADARLPADYLAAIDGIQIGAGIGSCPAVAFAGEPVICGNLETDANWANYRELAREAGFKACWSVPFFDNAGDVMGAYALYLDRTGLPTPHQLLLLEETARFAALVVDRHRDRRRLENMALYDSLTDLPNRKLTEQLLAAAIARAQQSGEYIAFGVLDIDRFKAINDAFGHHVGDRVLRSIAERLESSLREGDVIGRMAGDSFLFIFPDLANASDGIEAANRLIGQFAAAFDVEGYEIVARPSLGLAFYPATATDVVGLFQAADKAMYDAKMRGGGLELATVPTAGSSLKLLDLEMDLRHALEHGEFELHYQMMFDLANGRPVGAEALLRWKHPRLGMISPADFIPLAEANGTIVPIGTWVIGEAARVARSWQNEGHDAFVTVNVSALQFDVPGGLVATVVDALQSTGLEPRRLHLELTESLVMRNPDACAVTLLQLKALGVSIVIDDFGTGYSSLAYLQRFVFDALKIDRAFVSGIGVDETSKRSEHIVTAVVQLAAALGVTTIVEGVEDSAQYAFVASCGCSLVQGFLCARPVRADRLSWLSTTGVSMPDPALVAS